MKTTLLKQMKSADRGLVRLGWGAKGRGRQGSLGFHRKSPRTIMVERLLSSPFSLLGALIASILCVKHISDTCSHFSSSLCIPPLLNGIWWMVSVQCFLSLILWKLIFMSTHFIKRGLEMQKYGVKQVLFLCCPFFLRRTSCYKKARLITSWIMRPSSIT